MWRKWLYGFNKEKVLPTLFNWRNFFHVLLLTGFLSSWLFARGNYPMKDPNPSCSICDVSHSEPGGLSTDDWQYFYLEGKRRNPVTGNSECGFRNCCLSRVEKLFDLLTHFIGIGENNLVWFSLLVLEDSRISVSANKMNWRKVVLTLAVPTCLLS